MQAKETVSAYAAQARAELAELPDVPGRVALANLVAFDRSVKPKQFAMFGLSGAGADVLVDNLNDAKIVDRINGWVKDKTHGLIPSVIEEIVWSLAPGIASTATGCPARPPA